MSFKRTQSGLSNLHLFLGVEAVVFLEGGESISREKVDKGEFTESSSDIRFWQTLFGIYKPQKNYHFRSIGSKEIAKSIACDIKAGTVKNTIVAMDRDFDHINGRIIFSENVMYTKGYSWENDAWNKITILDAYCTLSGACKNNIQNETIVVDDTMTLFFSKMCHVIRIDAILSQYDCSVIKRQRKQTMRYLNIDKNRPPAINADELKKSLSEARVKVGKPVIRKSELKLNASLDCFGHLLAEYTYRILVYLLGDFRKLPSIPKEYATSMIVEKFGRAIEEEKLLDVKEHYDLEFKRLTF